MHISTLAAPYKCDGQGEGDALFQVSILRSENKEARSWPATIGMNEKGEMMDNEFKKYIDNAIFPIYPNMEDRPGKHVLLMVDSGRECNGKELLMKSCFCMLHINPGLTNATSLQQETGMHYGSFKTI